MNQKAKLAAIVLTSLLAGRSDAAINNYSIGLHFATDYAAGSTLDATDVAGYPAVAQANWNNFTGANGTNDLVVANSNGTSIATSVHLEWTSANTWGSGAHGAQFRPGTPDNKLMVTYLDTANSSTSTITITNIPNALTNQGFDVYIYAIGDSAATPPRGGSYRIVNPVGGAVLANYKIVATAINSTNFVQDLGTTHTNNENGNYLIFRGLTNSAIRIEATTTVNAQNGTPRAPVNGVQLVAARSTGEAGSATALTLATNVGTGKIALSWTPGATSAGTLILGRQGALVTAQPVDGVTYNANTSFGSGDNLGDDWVGAPNFVVYSGAASTATISALFPLSTYNFAVFSYTGSGAGINYTVASAPTGGAVVPGVPTNILVNVPSTMVNGSARRVTVSALYDNGLAANVTALATYSSSASNIVTIQALGRLAALTNGGPVTITVAYSGYTNQTAVSVVGMARTHRWSFNEAAGATTFVDSDAGSNGTLQNGSGFSGATGSQVSLSGITGDYVTLPPDLLTNYGAVTLEAWATDVGAVNGARIASFANDANRFTGLSSQAGGAGVAGGPRGSINDGTGAQNLTGANVPAGAEHHFVFTVEGATRTAKLYVDGLLVAQNAAYPFMPEDVGSTASNWLGRSEGGGVYLNGGISELRTYNGALDPLSIAVNTVAGPDTLISNPGALQSLTLTLNPTTMNEGDTQLVNTIGNFANVSHVDITTVASYTSSATNVATVSATGILLARSAGNTTISAIYSGQTNSVVLTVLAKPLGLKHRYSFTSDASDSIAPGAGDGTVFGTATFAGGQAVFDGINANTAYVALPPDLFTTYNSTTIEAWYTDDNAGTWNRVWDFGANNANYIFLSVNAGNTMNARTAIRNTSTGEQVLNFRRPAQGKEHHVAYTQDWISQTARVYVDGVLVATNFGVTLRPRDMVGPTAQMWIARSQFPADNFFRGSMNELRIWEGANTPTQIALSYGLGPNSFTTLTNPGAVSTVSVAVSAAVAGQIQQAKAMVNFASLANVNMAPSASNWVSSDVTVAKVDQTGVVTAVGAGNATISATFSGVTGNGALAVSAAPATVLAHRYSFTNDVTDSIAGSNGTLAAGATISGGAVVLTGAADSQVNLPGHLFDGFSAVTIETWATFTNSTPNNASLWGFGNPSDTVRTWLAFIPQGNAAGDTRIRYFLNHTNSAAIGEVTLAKRGRPVGAGTGTTNVHYVVVVNPPLGQADLYINGVFQETFSWTRPEHANIVPIDLSKLSNEQGFLGHTVQTNGTPAANAITTIDEFRIWNGALNKAQVAASYAAGPNNPVIDPGAASAITLKLSDPTAVVGTTQRPSVRGTFTGGTLDLTGISGVGLSSDNTAIVLVDGDRLRAVAAGTANITARYGGKTDIKPVTVITKQLTMMHQYSFTADASDSKGGADGALWGSAIISNGAVVLNGSTAPLTFVDLPANLIGGYDAVSLEMFGTVTANVANNRLFDFGDTANGTGVSYLSLDPNGSRVFTLAPNPVRNGTQAGGGVAEVSATTTARTGTFHVVGVLDETNPAAKTIRYYTNGVLAVTTTSGNMNVSTLINNWSFLGRSVWVGDPLFNGTINEFRVYYGAMSAADVTASFTAGPDTVPSVAPKLNVSQSGSSIVLSWSDPTYSLVAAGAVDAAAGTYTNVTGATSPFTTAPSQQQLYYRLKK